MIDRHTMKHTNSAPPNVSLTFRVHPQVVKDFDILTKVMGCESKNEVLVKLSRAAMRIPVEYAGQLSEITNLMNHCDALIEHSKALEGFYDNIE